MYYNRFRYYDPEQGNYFQVDPIGLAGNNPTLYGYVRDPLIENDPFGLKVSPFAFGSKKAALRYAKELAGIPRSQQPDRQWVEGDDVNRKGGNFANYEYNSNPTAHGRYYEFADDKGHKKVVVLHTNDPNRSVHAHAGKAKPKANPFTYDFKHPDNRYLAIDDPRTKDHHIDIKKKCKG